MLGNILKSQIQRKLANKSALVSLPMRFEGSYPWQQSMADNIPKKNHKIADSTLDESEVITRILFVLKNYHIYDLETFDWEKKFEDQGVDSLESTSLLTSIEHEFHTIFEDRVFEHFENLNQVKRHITLDHNCF
eukprot:403372802